MITNEIISPYFENAVFSGVRVALGDEDFVIAAKDFRNGKEMSWPEAMDALKADNLSTWNYRQICLTMAYREDIDKVLEANGGDVLDNWYWTRVEYSDNESFIYIGANGILDDNIKTNTFSIRPIKNLKSAFEYE